MAVSKNYFVSVCFTGSGDRDFLHWLADDAEVHWTLAAARAALAGPAAALRESIGPGQRLLILQDGSFAALRQLLAAEYGGLRYACAPAPASAAELQTLSACVAADCCWSPEPLAECLGVPSGLSRRHAASGPAATGRPERVLGVAWGNGKPRAAPNRQAPLGGAAGAWLLAAPLGHWQTLHLLRSALSAGRAVVLGNSADPARLLAAGAARNAAASHWQPWQLGTLLAASSGSPVPLLPASHRLWVAGGAWPAAWQRRLTNGQAASVQQAYYRAGVAGGLVAGAAAPPGAVGRSAAVAVLGAEGEPLEAGRVGQVVLHGQPVGSDQGWLDEAGWLHLQGAAESAAAAGDGEPGTGALWPGEACAVLAEHPAVADVAARWLFGDAASPGLTAWVATAQPLPDPVFEVDLLRLCRERLSAPKCPERIVPLQRLPRRADGALDLPAAIAAADWPVSTGR